MDLVFVLATKLDLNVNDMRELLDNSLKDNSLQFESMTNKMNDNFQQLNSEIEKLKNENKHQNETIEHMKEQHRVAVNNHEKLQESFTKLSEDYQTRVVDNHGDRLKNAELNIVKLEENVGKLKKDCIDDFEKSVKKIENMEIDLLNKMEAHGKSQNSKWMKQSLDTEEKTNKSFRSVTTRLDDHDVRIINLKDEVKHNKEDFVRYQEENNNTIKNIQEALAR